jgi:hypothetical protein|nr:MAG TPA_asm: nucleoid-associated protein [Caudoviricetes sp.]
MTIEQRVAVLEEIFAKLRDYYILLYSGEEIDALLASAGVPIGITKEYQSVAEMNQNFAGTDVARGQFVLILPESASSPDYGKVYLKGTANWVYVFTLTSLTAIKGPQGPAGKRGAKGADGADGKNFMVLGYYETLSALNAAVPSPGTGDTYGVGTEPPYAFYMYDPTISNWRYVGNLQGPAGPTGGEDNFVRYDAAQSLTDEQKAQARTNIGADTVQGAVRYDAAQTLADAQKTQARSNIGAAPDGFGLGGSAQTISTDWNEALSNGWWKDGNDNLLNHPFPGLWGIGLTTNYTEGSHLVQSAFWVDNDGSVYQKIRGRYQGGTWGAWEWVNPPMQLGVEYRTIERYLGKPVYVKVVDCGKFPAPGSSKMVAHGISNCVPISITAQMSNSNTVPYVNYYTIGTDGYNIILGSTSDVSDQSGNNTVALMRYTKTTD